MEQWDGRPLTLARLCELTGRCRTVIWKDQHPRHDPESGAELPPLLGAATRRPGVRGSIFSREVIAKYLRQKFPHLLPPRQ